MIGYSIGTTESHAILAVTCTASRMQDDIAKTIRIAFATIAQHMQEHGVMAMGPAVTVYHSIDEKEVRFSVGFPVMESDFGKTTDDISIIKLPGGKVAQAYHKGPYSKLFSTYIAMYKKMTQSGLDHGGIAWEVYLDSPGQTPREEMMTQICIGVGGTA